MSQADRAPTSSVSVVVPTRNRWDMLARAVRSALCQLQQPLEVLVVDDGSMTAAPDEIQGLPGVTLLRQPTARGVAAARNAGAQAARGDWLAFLDDDDLWAPHKLAGQLSVAISTGADMVASGALMVDKDLRPLWAEMPPAEDTTSALLHANVMPAGSSNVLLTRRAFFNAGRFDDQLTHIADWDLWIRATRVSSFAADPTVRVACVQHGGNMAADDSSEILADLDRMRAKYREDLLDVAFEPDVHALSRWRARSELRGGRRISAARAYAEAAARYRDPTDVARCIAALVLPAWDVRPWRRRPLAPEWLDAAGSDSTTTRRVGA